MSQKGGTALILLIVVIVLGLAAGVYLVSQNTNFFSKAGSAQMTIPYPNPSHANMSSSGESNIGPEYENPFDEKTSYENPFDNL